MLAMSSRPSENNHILSYNSCSQTGGPQMTDSGNNLQSAWTKIIAQAWSDDEYKSRILDAPREVLEEAGFNVPEEIELSVSDGGPPRVHLVIPPAPENFDAEIGDESLEGISGGFCKYCSCLCEFMGL